MRDCKILSEKHQIFFVLENSQQSNGKNGNGKRKIKFTYEVLTKLQETVDAYGIARQEKAYGKLLRISVQNKT